MIVVGNGIFAQKKAVSDSTFIVQLPFRQTLSYTAVRAKNLVGAVKYQPLLSADFYAKQLGFFCKQEIKTDKAFKIPLRFRLGSVDQCNFLEGKSKR